MKKGVLYLAVVLITVWAAVAAEPVYTNTSNGSAIVCNDYQILDFSTIYHYDHGSGVGRNQDYPTYEYTFRTDLVHFWMKVDANSVYALEHADVRVLLTHGCNGRTISVPLSFVTGIGAQYDPATGRYSGEFEGDWIVPTDAAAVPSGDYFVAAQVWYGGTLLAMDSLTALKYENVNDVLVLGPSDLQLQLQNNQGLMFNLVPLQFNKATDYPKHLTIVTPVDREGQGIIGNISLAVTDFTGTCPGGAVDTILASSIRMSKTEALNSWAWLWPNTAPITSASAFTLLGDDESSNGMYACPNNGGRWQSNLYFQLYFDANHCAASYTGGSVAARLAVY